MIFRRYEVAMRITLVSGKYKRYQRIGRRFTRGGARTFARRVQRLYEDPGFWKGGQKLAKGNYAFIIIDRRNGDRVVR